MVWHVGFLSPLSMGNVIFLGLMTAASLWFWGYQMPVSPPLPVMVPSYDPLHHYDLAVRWGQRKIPQRSAGEGGDTAINIFWMCSKQDQWRTGAKVLRRPSVIWVCDMETVTCTQYKPSVPPTCTAITPSLPDSTAHALPILPSAFLLPGDVTRPAPPPGVKHKSCGQLRLSAAHVWEFCFHSDRKRSYRNRK